MRKITGGSLPYLEFDIDLTIVFDELDIPDDQRRGHDETRNIYSICVWDWGDDLKHGIWPYEVSGIAIKVKSLLKKYKPGFYRDLIRLLVTQKDMKKKKKKEDKKRPPASSEGGATKITCVK